MSDHSTHAHKHPSAKLYVAILGALMVLTVITVFAAGINFGSPSVNVVIALFIATIKASLVALFFMHLLYDKGINALIFLTGIVFLGIFLAFCLIDTDSRPDLIPANLKVPLPASLAPAGAAPAGAAAVPPAGTAAAPAAAPAAEHH